MATYHLWEGCPDNSPIWPASWYGAGAYRTILNEAITLNVYGWNIGTEELHLPIENYQV